MTLARTGQRYRALTCDQETRLCAVLPVYATFDDQAVFSLVLDAGLRIRECAALTVDDLLLGEVQLRLHLRGHMLHQPPRTVVLDANTACILANWVAARRRRCPQPHSASLFLNATLHRLGPSMIGARIQTLGQELGIELTADLLHATYRQKCRRLS